ncbi:TauD-domain-containing protein [Macroventuria anomochaeta]|uniref:TauD-domain-containing protein n=1 Tax=Macroventuria anomochaeta TaxID=301207 RepID=A0ACB6SFD9_9PLEO|nr:TauD-domain-containing protein [Macroventuria anomochaeta]KAF2632990.1 TauD-domain-containing protein [Macroventuria anomochaeta]
MVTETVTLNTKSIDAPAQSQYPRKTLKLKGVLDQYESFDMTPVIGREFVDVNLEEWLEASNSDELVRDPAITISQRSVFFFRKQDDLNNDLQKQLAQSLDTLWASGYDLYDRLSPPYQKFFEGLTATYAQPGFNLAVKENGIDLYNKPRGAPENVGTEWIAEHPAIRTNPVTSWKSIFAVGHHVQQIKGLTKEESQHALDLFVQLIRWQNANDLAIWDNRSVHHTATVDYKGLGLRTEQ